MERTRFGRENNWLAHLSSNASKSRPSRMFSLGSQVLCLQNTSKIFIFNFFNFFFLRDFIFKKTLFEKLQYFKKEKRSAEIKYNKRIYKWLQSINRTGAFSWITRHLRWRLYKTIVTLQICIYNLNFKCRIWF